MDGNPRKRLRWYMDFIAKNISTLSENEFQVLLREYLKMPLPLLTEFPSIKIKGEKTLEEWSKFFSEPSLLYNKENSEPFIEDQKQLREFINGVETKVEEESKMDKQGNVQWVTDPKQGETQMNLEGVGNAVLKEAGIKEPSSGGGYVLTQEHKDNKFGPKE